MDIIKFIQDLFWSSLNILNGASVWLVISFLLAGLLHEVLSPDKFQKVLGNKKISSIIKSTISGMLLPICSCGVIPLGISMYYSGAYLGPTLAFMTSTPMINPIAVILCYGLLGRDITIIYVITGFLGPLIIGVIGNMFAGKELKAPGIDGDIQKRVLVRQKKSFMEKIKMGMQWSLNDLAVVVSKYVILGMLMASIIFNIVPQEFIQKYLGEPSILSLGSVTILAAVMYVCAVGHIPFIAALIASGAAPGIAITFLMAGAATNLPELISLYKLIGKRTAFMYCGVVVGISVIVGYLTNVLLMPGFTPVLNFNSVNNTINTANKFMFVAPMWLKYLCSAIIVMFAMKSFYKSFKTMIEKRKCTA